MRNLLTYLLLIANFSVFAQDFWVSRDSINGPPRSAASSFVLGDEGFIIGGFNQNGFMRKMYSYDTDQNDWDDELSLGGLNGAGLNRGSASSFSIANKAYVTLGQGDTNPFFKDTWEYNPVTESWSQKANFIGESRRQAVAFVIADTAYVGTGYGASGYLSDFYKYTPSSNSWEQLNDFAGQPRKEACAFTIGSNGFVCTGDGGVYLNDHWRYLPETDIWIQQTDFPGAPRKGAACWSNGTAGFVATGEDNMANYTNDVYEFDPLSNTWTSRADFIGTGRTNAIAFYIDGLAFLGTGYNGELLDDFYGYQPILGKTAPPNANLKVYPNPMKNQTYISSDFEITTIKVLTLDGKDFTNHCVINGQGNVREIVNSDLNTGTYIIQAFGKSTQEFTSKCLFVQ